MNTRNTKIVAEKFKVLQQEACSKLEQFDAVEQFSNDAWNKEIGSGITRVISNGNVLEKGAINFSYVQGTYTEEMAKAAGMNPGEFTATGVSSIMHPRHPFAPIIHLNVRYFELNNGAAWFGGGIDLTPHYVDKKEAAVFHQALKTVCDTYDNNYYAKFKTCADDYFYLSHRNETRGVGGIFFDHLTFNSDDDFEKLFKFSSDLLSLYPDIYCSLLQKQINRPFSKQNTEWQKIRRSRYVEFNLLHDRGTKFGIASGGNTESILVSMPPNASWEYNFEPEKDSKEKETISLLKKGINWINETDE